MNSNLLDTLDNKKKVGSQGETCLVNAKIDDDSGS